MLHECFVGRLGTVGKRPPGLRNSSPHAGCLVMKHYFDWLPEEGAAVNKL